MVTAANLNNKIGTAKPCRSLFEFDNYGNSCRRPFSAMPATVLSATVFWISTTYINIPKHETLVAYIIYVQIDARIMPSMRAGKQAL